MRSGAVVTAWLVLVTLCVTTSAGAEEIEIDPEGRDGRQPAGWFVPTRGYAARMQAAGGVDGEACLHLTRLDADAPTFGNVMRSFDARPYGGKLVRLRAALRFEGAPPHGAQMWLRVDRGDQQGFFDNMGDRRVQTDAWGYHEIVGRVDDDATGISLGVMLLSEGDVWVDDMSLELLEAPQPEGSRAVRGRGLDNLVALAELLALVRHFHPSDEAAQADWDAVAVAGVGLVEPARSARALADTLSDLIAPLAPGVALSASSTFEAEPPVVETAGLDVMAWEHFGFGQEGKPPGLYGRKRVRAPVGSGALTRLLGKPSAADLPDPAAPLRVELPGGVTAWVPLAVYADDTGSLPRATAPPRHLPPPPLYTGDDRATRLAGVILAWGIFEHFYPYFDVVDVDWSAELRRALGEAAEAEDGADHLWVLRRLVASLDDGHGYVRHASRASLGWLPIAFAWAGDELVVSRVREGVDGVARGDVVVSADGRPLAEWVAERRQYVSAATEQYARFSLAGDLRYGPMGGSLRLRVQGASGRARGVELTYEAAPWDPRDPRPEPVAELEPDVLYVDISRVDDAEFEAAVPAMVAARRVVFDFRGYPGRLSPQVLFGHLIDGPTASAQWHVPKLQRPYGELTFVRLGEWNLQPVEPRVEAELVFVTDGRAISYAESCMGIVEHYGLGAIVGEATAGTNGNVNPFELPGGYNVNWTGMKVLKHDGSQHHGVGILPTHPVGRTVEGIRAGRDELLEAALALP